MLSTLISLAIPILIIFFICKKHQKKKRVEEEKKKQEAAKLAIKLQEEKEKREILDYLEKEATKICNVKLSENYFINLFMGWLDANEEDRVKAFYENKETLKTMTPEVMESLPERFVTSDVGAMFLETEEEWNKFATDKTQEDIDDIISGEILVTLGLYPILKDYIRVNSQADFYFAKPARDYFKILFAMQLYANNQESVSNTELMKSADIQVRALEDFQKLKWKEICENNPSLSSDFYYEKFIEFTKYDEAYVPWRDFYFDSIGNSANEYFGDWTTRYGNAITKLEEYPKIYNSIINGPSPYSSIYEIDDFSQENIDRIVSLYESGVIHGKYQKSKDPKYNNA